MKNNEKENLYLKTKTRLDKFSYWEFIKEKPLWFKYNFFISLFAFLGLIFFFNTPTITTQKLIAVIYSFTWLAQLYYVFFYPFYELLPEDLQYRLKNKRNSMRKPTKKEIKEWSIVNWYWIIIWILCFLLGYFIVN